MRKENQEISKRILLAQPLGSRRRGRRRLRWRDEDARLFAIRNWWMVERDGEEWRRFLEESKTQKLVLALMIIIIIIIIVIIMMNNSCWILK